MKNFTKILSLVLFTVALYFTSAQPASAAMQMPNGKATIWWRPAAGASKYRIYFREASEKMWTHAARGLYAPATSYTITYLKPGVVYKFQVAAVKDDGAEFWWSPVKTFWGNGGNYKAY